MEILKFDELRKVKKVAKPTIATGFTGPNGTSKRKLIMGATCGKGKVAHGCCS